MANNNQRTVFAAIGELVVEKSGVLNLGVEGMMILGAIAGFSVTLETGSYATGILAAAVVGALAAALFGVLTQGVAARRSEIGLRVALGAGRRDIVLSVLHRGLVLSAVGVGVGHETGLQHAVGRDAHARHQVAGAEGGLLGLGEVVAQHFLLGEVLRPVLGPERVRVHVGRDVARDARIGVLAPRAAQVVGLLEAHHVVDADVTQLDDRQDPRHARPDHRSPQGSLGPCVRTLRFV